MAKKTEADEKKKLPKGYSVIRIVRFCFLILTVVLLLWALYHFEEDLNLDNFLRFVSYLDAGEVDAENAAFRFNASASNRFAPFKNGLAVLSPEGLTYMNAVGREELEVKASFSKPALRANDRRLLAYDIGGKNLIVASDYSVLYNKMADAPIINARMNAKNWFVLITSDSGYKAGLTVFTDKQKAAYRWRTSEYYVTDADLSPDCKRLAACAFKYGEGEIVSRVFGFSLDKDTVAWECDLGNTLVLAVDYVADERIMVLTEQNVLYIDRNGEKIAEFDFEGMTLKACSDGGDGFWALLFMRNRVGSLHALVTLDYEGNVLGEIETDESIGELNACQNRVATLSPDGIKVYNKNMGIEGIFSQYSSANSVAVSAGGRLFCILPSSAFKIQE